MNKAISLTIEILLLLVYVGVVIWVIDTSTVFGIIQVGVLTAIIFPLVFFLEKKREKSMKQESTQQNPEQPLPVLDQSKQTSSQQDQITPPKAL